MRISMIDRYTIKFGPAVSQKELEKALNEGNDAPHVYKLPAKIEFIGDFVDIKKVKETLIQLLKHEESSL
jgi:hypothetical protein